MSARFAMRDCARCERQVLVKADGHCPRCDQLLLADQADQAGPVSRNVRLSPVSLQPHVCLQCGAPTHRLVRVRAVGPRPATALRAPESEKSSVPWYVYLVLPGGFGCLTMLVRGLGDLLADASTRRRPTLSVRVRQCRDCGAQGPPSGFAPDYPARRMSFAAHPRFAEALVLQIREVKRRQALSVAPSRGDDEARPH